MFRIPVRNFFKCNRLTLFNVPQRQFALKEKQSNAERLTLNFDELICKRRDEARCSILVQVNSEKSYSELFRYCSQYGDIVSAHHYSQDELHYIVLEYSEQRIVEEVINSSAYNEDSSGIVVQSPFLWFRAGPKTKLIRGDPLTAVPTDLSVIKPLSVEEGNRTLVDNEIDNALRLADNTSAQMHILHQSTCLNDIGIRLRFLAAKQIEQALSGMFPHACAYPFGSSVNGFGRLGCDLDLILRLSSEEKSADLNSRLVYHTKENLTKGRTQTQRQMECISDMLQLFLPGVCHVRRILQARVPIIKYRHDHLDLEVDLSMSNLTGAYMSEILYMFGQIDFRVMPLVFTVRRWAHSVGLTNSSPGRWISNFSLTCLVIFYLQQLSHPILPSINTLIAQSRRPDDVRITEDGINCTFLRDLKSLNFERNSDTGLDQLLIGFFEYYSQMDFKDCAISLNEGKPVHKPDHSPIYIVNPLEVHLNVSKNISLEECERFRISVRNAAWALDSVPNANCGSEWGVLSITKAPQMTQSVVRPNMFFKPRLVDVSELFEQERPQTNGIQFKNNMIKNIVDKIQRKGHADIDSVDSRLKAEVGQNNRTTTKPSALPSRVRKR